MTATVVPVTDRTGDRTNASADETDVTVRVALEGVAPEDDGERTAFLVDGAPLTLGSELRLDLGTYAASGTVTALDSDDDALTAEETTTDAEVELRNVTPGLQTRSRRDVRNRSRRDGRDDPVARERTGYRRPRERRRRYSRARASPKYRLTLTVELATTETETGASFRGRQLEIGTPVVFEFDAVTVDGEVTGIEWIRLKYAHRDA